MKRKLAIVSAALLAGTTIAAQAGTGSQADQLNQQIAKVSAQTTQLTQEVAALKAQLKHLKQQKVASHASKTNNHFGVHFVTTPVFGKKSSHDASELLANASSMNEDLGLLKRKVVLEKHLNQQGVSLNDRALVQISGDLTGQATVGKNYSGRTSDINLSGMDLDINALTSRWVSAFMNIAYDNGDLSLTGERINRIRNSHLYLDRAFVTVGNLNALPVYLSVGQMYSPFGKYSNNLISTPVTESLARINQRNLILGYAHAGLYAQVYGFKGDTYVGSGNTVNEAGINMGYHGQTGFLNHYDIGAGYVTSMTDSQGMLNNGQEEATGTFTGLDSYRHLYRRVPAADIHAEASIGPVDLMGEYISATHAFDKRDMTQNNGSVDPGALHLEAAYNFHFYGKAIKAGVGYGHTKDSLAFSIPKDSYMTYLSSYIFKNTVAKLEFRHDKEYNGTAVVGDGTTTSTSLSGTGEKRNLVMMQLETYF